MIDELNTALQSYSDEWDKLIEARSDRAFFEGLKPVAVGWKVADAAEYQRLYKELRGNCDRIVETWMNGRWIAKLHLRETKLTGGIEIVKLMQRRPGSDDALGLDHVDLYSPAVEHAEQVLAKEAGLKWTNESNDVVAGYEWVSIWFNGGEAKIKAGTVMDIVIQELEEINQHIKQS